ncbi:MAG: TfoX/Sxy family protein [Chloroflexi bacterium]|nr:TfoX/Sxy family protein [Chloroflexota bacterium]
MKAETVERLERALQDALMSLEPDKVVLSRSMFGGAGFFIDGRMVAAWFGGGLALKLPDDARRELRTLAGAKPTQSAQYIEVPGAFVDDPDLLVPWLEKSLAYVRSQPARKGR